MKTKLLIIILACVLLAAFVLGVTGAAQLTSAETAAGAAHGADRLIGALLTTQSLNLFDTEGYFNDHAAEILGGYELDEADAAAYEGRLYASLVETPHTDGDGGTTTMQEYVFEGVDGISCFSALYPSDSGDYRGVSGDEALSDVNLATNATDEGYGITIDGTVNVALDGPDSFFFNPVYQTESGEVYAVSGQGVSCGGDLSAGMSTTHELKEETTSTVAGETQSASTLIRITVRFVEPPAEVRVLQFGDGGELLASGTYAPETLPETLKTETGAEYIIVESRAAGGEAVRELYAPESESMSALYRRSDGLCVKQYCEIEWNN